MLTALLRSAMFMAIMSSLWQCSAPPNSLTHKRAGPVEKPTWSKLETYLTEVTPHPFLKEPHSHVQPRLFVRVVFAVLAAGMA